MPKLKLQRLFLKMKIYGSCFKEKGNEEFLRGDSFNTKAFIILLTEMILLLRLREKKLTSTEIAIFSDPEIQKRKENYRDTENEQQ